jgi:hypothetical protein
MDAAVALVQAYLRVNGYFTVSEYPVLEATRRGQYRMATDLDLLAFRFPHAGRRVLGDLPGGEPARFAPDPALGVPADEADMLIAEVKEGRAEFNAGTRDPDVLAAALLRFGCCSDHGAETAVEELLRSGRALLLNGHRIRMVAFGGRGGGGGAVDTVVPLARVVEFLRSHLEDHWDVLRHAQFKDSTLGLLMVMEKARR